MKIFLVGNGPTRKDFDLDSLKTKGLIVGCNWAYRDFEFDIICSGDREVSAKIEKEWSGDWIRRDDYGNKRNNRDNVYWNSHNEILCKLPQLNHAIGWNTGRMAVYALSLKYKPSTIYLLGFDMDRTNIYEEANMDARWKGEDPSFVSGWNSLFARVVSKVIRVGPKDNMTDSLNCGHITYKEFTNEVL